MNGPPSIGEMSVTLAQCSCGAGNDARLGYWAVLIAAAVVLLGVGVCAIWTRARANKVPGSDAEEAQRKQCNDE
jgi:hypothetical protein